MSLYIIAIGGTGARCVEAITYLSASGVFGDEPLNILFVDPDVSNGNLSRTRETLNRYENCRNLIIKQEKRFPWMRTPLIDFGLWSPFADSPHRTLNDLFHYNSYRQQNPNLGHLVDVLYTQDERQQKLDIGFCGRPAIGAAVMSLLGQEIWQTDPWKKFIAAINGDLGEGKSPKVFLIGSIFGGTGASGLPTIHRLIAQKLTSENKRQEVKLGSLLMLPYFQFPEPDTTNNIYARSDDFLLNTKAALRYYTSQQTEPNDELNFDVVYLMGSPDLAKVDSSSIGRNSQRNPPHFIELYAALATKNFFQQTPDQRVVLISRESPDRIAWSDIPDRQEVESALVTATRFAFAWLTGIVPDLEPARTIDWSEFQRLVPWSIEFFRPQLGFLLDLLRKDERLPEFTESDQQDALNTVSNWCEAYLKWLIEIHSGSGSSSIELFESIHLETKNVENFGSLIIDGRTDDQNRRDTVQRLKENLSSNSSTAVGTIGLARSLYELCTLNPST